MLSRTTSQIETLEHDLNRTIVQGRFLDAFTHFYDPRAIMRPPLVLGNVVPDVDPALRFFDWVETFVGAVPMRVAVSDDVAYSEWIRTGAEGRARTATTRVVARRWVEGRVVEERVYDHPTAAQGTVRDGEEQ